MVAGAGGSLAVALPLLAAAAAPAGTATTAAAAARVPAWPPEHRPMLASLPAPSRSSFSVPPAVSFDGTAVLWEPEVPGEAEAAAEEAEAAAEAQQPGGGRSAARRASGGRAHGLPEPSGDQLVW